ncbi:MAG: efflux RND transporter periplasmic adaptor subunit [Nitrospirae bacterium]|nr:efflux RND transporter periplasmic adaptor subunit [Nitrospirota bacterium]MBI5694114.1 efflux RND transporter periplasmic adaptor subunit [Nitrospirota bacterium]
MSRKTLTIFIVIAALLAAGIGYRFYSLKGGGGHAGHDEHTEAGHEAEGADVHGEEGEAGHEGEEAGGHEEARAVTVDLETQKKSGITVAVAGKAPLGGSITSTGKVEADGDRVAHVAPAVTGRIASVSASLGDYVKSGQTLARVESIEAGEALARYEQAKARAGLAAANLDRVKLLVEKKIAARKEILAAETEHLNAMSEVRAEERRLSLYGVSGDDIRKASGGRVLVPVQSPLSGTITEKHVVPGEYAGAGSPMFSVSDLSNVWVQVDVHEGDVPKVRKGQAAAVKANAFPDKPFKGRVTYIADSVDEATRTVRARVEVANPERLLKPEMFVTVELTLPAEGPEALSVPADALMEHEGGAIIYVTEDGMSFAPREVVLGRRSGGMAEVVSGLDEGEKYASSGVFIIKSEFGKGELGEHGH